MPPAKFCSTSGRFVDEAKRPWWHVLFLGILTGLVYSRAFHAGILWDDAAHLSLDGSLYKSTSALFHIWCRPGDTQQYYPLTFSIFWLQFKLWGTAPFGYHAVNILLHAANAIGLVILLRTLGLRGAEMAGVLFALHPVHVESVAWISELKNVLSTLFALLSLYGLFRFWAKDRASRAGWYFTSLGFFVCALASKTITCSLPAVALVICWWKWGRIRLSQAAALVPFFLLGAGSAVLTTIIESRCAGATGPEWNFSWVQRILIAGRAAWFYLGKLLWPYPLSFIYPRWEINASHNLAYMYPILALAAGGFLYFFRNRLGRGPLAVYLLFVGTLVPCLGFFNIYPMRFSFVANHFEYLSSIPILAGIGYLLRQRKATLLFILIAALFSVRTFIETGKYRDNKTLWLATVRQNPLGWLPNTTLATIFLDENQTEAARPYLTNAISQNPPVYLPYDLLGRIEAGAGRRDRAEYWYRVAQNHEPGIPPVYNHLGDLLLEEGRVDAALVQYQAARQLMEAQLLIRLPTYAEREAGKRLYAMTLDRLAGVSASRRRWKEALFWIQEGLKADPQSVPLQNHLTLVAKALGKP